MLFHKWKHDYVCTHCLSMFMLASVSVCILFFGTQGKIVNRVHFISRALLPRFVQRLTFFCVLWRNSDNHQRDNHSQDSFL